MGEVGTDERDGNGRESLAGTPHGVGMARAPPLWLKAGDSITIEIEKIGALINPVVEEILRT